MKISEVAKITGLTPKTLRYYESLGLVGASHRGENGYRYYSDGDLRELGFVQRARSLGFSLEECASLLALFRDPARASASVKEVASRRITDLDQQIARLQEMRQGLHQLIAQCHGDHSPECAIIDSLAGDHG